MSEICFAEIEKTIRRAVETGDTLFVGTAAKAIAGLCGGSPRQIADELTKAGIRAGVTMQFSRPD